jgi:glycosyltransferase involved in cell wall biosynthesis
MERLLFCTSSLAWGGAERHAITLMNRLAERGHACHAVYIKKDSGQRERIRLHGGSAVDCLGVTRYLDGGAMARFGESVRRFQPSVIVAANPYALLYSAIACHLACMQVPLVVIFHSTRILSLKERLQMLAYRLLFWTADCTVFVCHQQRRYWERRGVCSRRNEVIYNGVDLREFRDSADADERAQVRRSLGLHDGHYVIGITAGLRPEKNHTQLVDAVARLRRRGIPARALLIGDGEMRETIVALARRLAISDDVIITGFQPDVRPFIRACDTMVLCSLTETLSLAVIEAMALGRPVVHSNVGGAAELVVPGRNGFLFPVGDTEALVHKLALLREPALARHMGDAARERVEERFSEASMVVRYEQVLSEVSRASAGRGPKVSHHEC